MECRKLEVTQVSAQNLENVRRVFKSRIRFCAKVSLGGYHRTVKTTKVDKVGKTNPVWNFTCVYNILKDTEKSEDTKLHIRLYCHRTSGDTKIGQVSVSLKELFHHFSTLPPAQDTATVKYPVKNDGVDAGGEVSFSYKFGDLSVYVPPPIDWRKVGRNGAKLIWSGGKLCLSLLSIAGVDVFDVPIDCVVDIGVTSFDILSIILGAGSIADKPI